MQVVTFGVGSTEANYKKSKAGVNAQDEVLAAMSLFFGCQLGPFLTKCLGLPLFNRYLRIQDYHQLIERFKHKLSTWKSGSLSCRGWLVLCKSARLLDAVFSLHVQRSSSVLLSLDMIRRIFFWPRSIEWHDTNWGRIYKPKVVACLGIKDLKTSILS